MRPLPITSSRPLLAALLAVIAAPGCERATAPVVLDLALTAPIADRATACDLVVFGVPAAEAHQASGFVWAKGTDGGDGHVWAAGRAELRFRWREPEPRFALLDMAPYPGLPAQTVEVFLNENSMGRVALDVGRRRYGVALTAKAQRAGVNVLRLAFATGTPALKPHRLHLAASVYSVAVGPASDPALTDLMLRDAPPPLSVDAMGGRPRLLQVGPSHLSWAFAAPARAELRLAPDLHPLARKAGATARFRVTLEVEDGPERELWSAGIGPADSAPGEVALRLGVAPGTPVRVGLHVEGASSHRFAWGVWSAPRLHGRGAIDPLVAEPRGEDGRAEALRRSLSGSNVLLVLLDAAGARHFSCYGYPRATTPEIDRIASEGVLFEQAYSPASFTLLAMSSIWTSQYPDQHHNGIPYNSKLPKQALTLAEVLASQGIRTAGFVDNLLAGRTYGLDQGFAEFDEINRRLPMAQADVFHGVLASWLEANKGRPFFSYLHLREPHFPYAPPAPFDTIFGPPGPLDDAARTKLDWLTDVNWGRRTAKPEEIDHLVRLYDGNLRYADQEVGALRRLLEATGLWERTIVILTADHGDALNEHGYIGHLYQVYEDIAHVPLIVRFPKGKGPHGLRVRGFVDLTELAPTVTDVFGVPGKGGSDRAFRGRSLLPVILGAPGKRAVFSRTAEDQPKYALRHERFKLIYNTARGQSELYDLEADPGERDDLGGRWPVRTSLYRQAIERWILEARRGAKAVEEEVALSDEQKEQLKALGYVR